MGRFVGAPHAPYEKCQNIARCRARMLDNWKASVTRQTARPRGQLNIRGNAIQPEARYRPAAADERHSKRSHGSFLAPSDPKTGVIRLQPVSLSCKRHKVCNPKTGTASNSRGSTDPSLNTSSCLLISEFSSDLNASGHTLLSAVGGAKCSTFSMSKAFHDTGQKC